MKVKITIENLNHTSVCGIYKICDVLKLKGKNYKKLYVNLNLLKLSCKCYINRKSKLS